MCIQSLFEASETSSVANAEEVTRVHAIYLYNYMKAPCKAMRPDMEQVCVRIGNFSFDAWSQELGSSFETGSKRGHVAWHESIIYSSLEFAWCWVSGIGILLRTMSHARTCGLTW